MRLRMICSACSTHVRRGRARPRAARARARRSAAAGALRRSRGSETVASPRRARPARLSSFASRTTQARPRDSTVNAPDLRVAAARARCRARRDRSCCRSPARCPRRRADAVPPCRSRPSRTGCCQRPPRRAPAARTSARASTMRRDRRARRRVPPGTDRSDSRLLPLPSRASVRGGVCTRLDGDRGRPAPAPWERSRPSRTFVAERHHAPVDARTLITTWSLRFKRQRSACRAPCAACCSGRMSEEVEDRDDQRRTAASCTDRRRAATRLAAAAPTPSTTLRPRSGGRRAPAPGRTAFGERRPGSRASGAR